jgi:hypothetical protein
MNAIIGLLGVVVGAGLTYAIQWHLGKRQRQWAVEDSRTQYEKSIADDVRKNRYERLRKKMDVLSEQLGRKSAYLDYLESGELEYPTIAKEEAHALKGSILSCEGLVFSALSAIGSEELRQLHREFNSAFYELLQGGWDQRNSVKASKAEDALAKRMEEMLDETLRGG